MEIKTKEIDPTGSRTSILKLGRRNIETPFRSLPHTDFTKYYNGHDLLNDKAITLPFVEFVKDFDGIQLNALINSQNAYVKSDKYRLNKFKDTPIIFIPRIEDNIKISAAQMSALINYQSNLIIPSVISVPDPGIK